MFTQQLFLGMHQPQSHNSSQLSIVNLILLKNLNIKQNTICFNIKDFYTDICVISSIIHLINAYFIFLNHLVIRNDNMQ